MKKVPLLLSLAATVLSLASCEKELDNVNVPAQTAAVSATESKASLLTTGDWKLTSMTAVSGQSETNLFAMLKSAQRDNLSKFRAAGQFLLDEGATKRDDAAAQLAEGTWEFRANGDSLNVTSAGTVSRYAVAELSASTLRLTRTSGATDGKAATVYTSVYAH